MITRPTRRAVRFLTAVTIAIAVATPAMAEIKVRECFSIQRQAMCLCMENTETGLQRKLCPVEGSDCWDDTGWMSAHFDGDSSLPTYLDNMGNLYIVVGADHGGIFSSGTVGMCLPFTSSSTGTIILPADLVM